MTAFPGSTQKSTMRTRFVSVLLKRYPQGRQRFSVRNSLGVTADGDTSSYLSIRQGSTREGSFEVGRRGRAAVLGGDLWGSQRKTWQLRDRKGQIAENLQVQVYCPSFARTGRSGSQDNVTVPEIRGPTLRQYGRASAASVFEGHPRRPMNWWTRRAKHRHRDWHHIRHGGWRLTLRYGLPYRPYKAAAD